MILHITTRSEWTDAIARASYSPPSLRAEGFIHCSTIDQLAGTANLFFRGRRDLLVLIIDERTLDARLRYEAPAVPDPARSNSRFPHIHGPLNLDAVVEVIEFPPEADDSFKVPTAVLKAAQRT